jgi:putative YD repeat protein
MKQTLLLLMFLSLTIVRGQHTSGGYKPFLNQYGLKGKVKTLIEYNEYGSSTRYYFNKKRQLVSYQTYSSDGNKVKEIMFEYTDDGKLKTMKSDESLSVFTQLPDNVVQETVIVNISGIKAGETYLYTYDSKGNLLSKERKAKRGYDGINYKELYEYDSAGRLLVKKYDLAYMKNRKDSFGGNYNEKDNMEVYQYDTNRQLKKHTQYDTDGKIELIEDYKGGVLVSKQEYILGNFRGRTKYIYNNTTHQIREEYYEDKTGVKPSSTKVYQLTYDKMGNLILKVLIAEESSGKVKKFKGNDIQIEEKRELEYYP